MSDLTSKSKETQVNTLIYSMGEEVNGMLYSFGLIDSGRKKYNTVSNKSKTTVKRNYKSSNLSDH